MEGTGRNLPEPAEICLKCAAKPGRGNCTDSLPPAGVAANQVGVHLGRQIVTTGNVLTIFILILLLLVADALWLHWNLPVRTGRAFVDLVEYLSFWR